MAAQEHPALIMDQEQVVVFPAYKRTVWATNLPYGIDEERVRQIFREYGEIESVNIGPTGMTANIVYEEPWRAHQAVKRIRLMEPLIIDSKPICVSRLQNNEERYHRRFRLINNYFNRIEAVYTVHVSNLALTVTAAALRDFFGQFGPVRGDPIIYRADRQTLYSFVTFHTIAARRQAERARGSYFHLRRLVVRPCDPNQFQVRQI